MQSSVSNNHHSPWSGAALRIAVMYAIVSALYILCSDALLGIFLSQATITKLTQLQTLKGVLFVLMTATFLFELVRRAIRDLDKTQQSLSKAQEIAHLGNWEWELLTDRVTWSEEMYHLFERPREQGPLVYERFAELFDPADRARVMEPIERALKAGEPFRIDFRLPRAKGDKWILAQGEVTRDNSGKVVRLFGTCQDITARKLMEQELRRFNEMLEQRVAQRTGELQQANEDLRTFSYTVSHDLRTPLRSMTRTAAELLQTACGRSDEEAQECARRIAGAAARLDRLIQDLFEYNKLARAEIRPQGVNLLLLAHDVAGQLHRDPDFAEAEIVIREPMPAVLAHRPTLTLVLLNLIQNAVKYVAPGRSAIVTIYAEQRGRVARLTVEDNGVGMEPARVATIFSLFEQPHESSDTGGSGIGLAIVRRGVERMGGTVGVESSPGAGSRFWIELPTDPA
jgi:signal transduction histidine kinase